MKMCRHFTMNDTKLGWRLPKVFWRATGRYIEDPVLNPFGGHSPIGIRCDIDSAVKPHVLCDALRLPFADESFATVIFDPPYSLVNRPLSVSLCEAIRCTRTGGHVLYIHTVHPPQYRSCPIIAIHFLSAGFRHVRIVAIFKKLQHIEFDNTGRMLYREPRRKGIMQAQLHDGRKKSERQRSLDFSLDNNG